MAGSHNDFAASDLHHLLFERILGEEDGGGGGGETKKSGLYNYMVYSPSYYIATVTALIVIVSLLFEKIIHVIHHWFGHKKNKALVHVVDRIKDELMVAGFLSIVLALINPLLAGWCVPVARDTILIPCQPPDKASPYNSYYSPPPVPADATANYTDKGFPWVQTSHTGVTPNGENGTTFSTVVNTERFANGTGVEIRETTITFRNGTKMKTTTRNVFVGNGTGAVTNNTNLTTPDKSTDTPLHGHGGELFPHFDSSNNINNGHERGLLESTSHKNSDVSSSGIENRIRRLILDWERQIDQEEHNRLLLEGDGGWEHGSRFIHHARRKLASFPNECPPGQEPLMSPSAIHQLHLFIFFLVAGHIVYTCITIVIARAKVSTWHRWENKCQEKMKQRKGAVSGQLTRALQDRSFILRHTGPLASFRRRVAPDVADAGSSSAGGGYDVEQPPPSVEQEPELARTFQEVVKEGEEAKAQGSQEQQVREQAQAQEAREPARRSSKLQVHYSDEDDVAEEKEPEHFTWIGEEEEGDDLDTVYEDEEEREEEENKEKEWRRQTGMKEGGDQGKKRLTRLATMARKEASTELTVWQSLVLTVQCFFQQLFNPITRSDYYTLRLAFIHNQDLPRDFDFYHYVVGSLEKDFVHIVGLSLPLWITLIIVICITSYKWDISFIFSVLGFLIALAVGTKLEYIVSLLALESAHVTGDCEGCHLKPRGSLFWFKRPSFMLGLLHFALFISSYMIGNLVVYYYLALNQSQCKAYSAWVPWLKFIIGIATVLLCSLSTLPLYALLTHMGGKPSHLDEGRKQGKIASVFTEQMKKIKEHRSKDDVRA